ncbi:MAG: Stp1/IreP family PP2C-type Ser/Thr phosphatase [Proteobacteria bacterium]|nr:Stp1/IreP family PP2C-type Ser/Thr phosphatase [Pseudomonadota bacterium]
MNFRGKLQFVARTDVGQVRDHNEDFITENESKGFAVLADGMGGLNAGEVASSMAVHLLIDALAEYRNGSSLVAAEINSSDSDLSAESQVLRKLVEKTNDSLFHVSQTQPQCQGMGTTVVAAYYHNDKVSVAHIGDSRMYRFRAGVLEQITKDHSFVQELIDKGLLTKEEARASNKKNVVTRALGVAPFVEVEVHEHEVEKGDVYLMCSDGLHDLVTDHDIENSLIELSSNLNELAGHLVNLANISGGKDNISIVLTRVLKPYPAEGGLLEKIANWFE